MFSNLFGKKPDHPLGDIKYVQALLDDLPRHDTHKSLMDLTEWIASVSNNSDFKLDYQFAVLRLLDEAARPYAFNLAHYYFTLHEPNKFQEHRLWLALSNLSQQTSNAYYQVFNRYCSGNKGNSAIAAQVPLLAARTVHAMTGQLKYICAHYSPIDKTIWANLAQLCQHAEQQQYLDTPLNLYPSDTDGTTLKYELAHLLGWQGCGVSTLGPLNMHLTERITKRFCSSMDIGAQQDTSSLFSFDLAHPAAPARVNVVSSDTTAHPNMRFVSMAAMQPKLEALIKMLEQNIVPQNLNMGGIYSVEVVHKAVKYLLDYLVAPPTRHNPHRKTSGYLNVLNGFDRVIDYANDWPDSCNNQPLRWKIEDISANGFRTTLPPQGADDIRVGSLVGVQADGVAHCGVAIVRRLMRDDTGELHVGAEILSHQIASVTVKQGGYGGKGTEDAQAALWLFTKQDDSSGEVQLLLKAGTFSVYNSLNAQMNGKKYLLIPHSLQEKSSDYDLARFRAIVHDEDPE